MQQIISRTNLRHRRVKSSSHVPLPRGNDRHANRTFNATLQRNLSLHTAQNVRIWILHSTRVNTWDFFVDYCLRVVLLTSRCRTPSANVYDPNRMNLNFRNFLAPLLTRRYRKPKPPQGRRQNPRRAVAKHRHGFER